MLLSPKIIKIRPIPHLSKLQLVNVGAFLRHCVVVVVVVVMVVVVSTCSSSSGGGGGGGGGKYM